MSLPNTLPAPDCYVSRPKHENNLAARNAPQSSRSTRVAGRAARCLALAPSGHSTVPGLHKLRQGDVHEGSCNGRARQCAAGCTHPLHRVRGNTPPACHSLITSGCMGRDIFLSWDGLRCAWRRGQCMPVLAVCQSASAGCCKSDWNSSWFIHSSPFASCEHNQCIVCKRTSPAGPHSHDSLSPGTRVARQGLHPPHHAPQCPASSWCRLWCLQVVEPASS